MAYAVRWMHSVTFILLVVLVPHLALAQAVSVQTTAFSFSNQGAALAGDLYMPAHPVAALVLVHGAGPTKRMQRTAQLFAEQGFVVATWDKRGVGNSGGRYEANRNTSAENLALLAGDAAAAMDWLATQAEVAGLPLGYWGISQAGWIIPLAALRTPQADFITLWSGPLCTVAEEMEAGIGTGGNLSSDDVARAFIAELRAQRTDTDPRDALRKIHIPGLWLFGGRDNTLPVGLSIKRMQGLIAAGQSHFEYRLDPDAGHNMNFETDRAGIDRMIEWMRARTDLDKADPLGMNAVLDSTEYHSLTR